MAWRAKQKVSSPPERSSKSSKSTPTGTPTVKVIAEIEKQRDSRRKAMAAAKKERKQENLLNEKLGKPGDVDFQRMIKKYRKEFSATEMVHTQPGETKINICVRKRPINGKELKRKDHDAVTCINPGAVVHECKLKVDGITKYLDNNKFAFDHTFNENSTNEQVYEYTAKPLVSFIFKNKGRATVFAYGQTGSGKTHTMEGIQHLAAIDIFEEIDRYNQSGANIEALVSFFEIYRGRCQDLLHKRRRLQIREDGKKEVQIIGLEETKVSNVNELFQMVEQGNELRTTHATEMNDTSSRSHGICQISIRDKSTSKLFGKLSLIDLAGSERGADTKNHNRQRRMESAEINTSLLALKECIRALDSKGGHVPFRASKLTLVLKDSFVNANARTVMIAAVSPCSTSTDHTVNTLRYADRVKENPTGKVGGRKNRHAAAPIADYASTPAPPPKVVNTAPASPPISYPPPPPAMNPKKSVVNQRIPPAREVMEVRSMSDSITSQDDIKMLHHSLRKQSQENIGDSDEEHYWEKLHETVLTLYEEEEQLLNTHMNSIQENAELLTEEGVLLASIQGDDVVDYDIDAYSARLSEILDKKANIIKNMQSTLSSFRRRLQDEESQSKNAPKLQSY